VTTFVPHPDFNHTGRSYRPVCPLTGLPKQAPGPRKQPHEVDEFVFRGPEIVFEDGRGSVSLGFFDVRPAAVAEAAETHLGMVPRAAHEAFRAETEGLRDELLAAQEALAVSQAETAASQAAVAAQARMIAALEGRITEYEADLQAALSRQGARGGPRPAAKHRSAA